MKIKQLLDPNKILVVISNPERLDEATQAKVGRFTAHRHQPHVPTDDYHAHADIPGGYEVSWDRSGRRHHPNKFPTTIPNDARLAVAKVLGVDPSILECYRTRDGDGGEELFLIEVKLPG